MRLPAENDRILAALGAAPAGAGPRGDSSSARPPRRRSASRSRSTAQGRARVATGIGFLDHLLTLLAFHGGLDLEVVAGGDLDVDEHHTVEDVLAALGDALGAGARTAATA